MTLKFTVMSLKIERYKFLSKMTKFNSLQENSMTDILILESVSECISGHLTALVMEFINLAICKTKTYCMD